MVDYVKRGKIYLLRKSGFSSFRFVRASTANALGNMHDANLHHAFFNHRNGLSGLIEVLGTFVRYGTNGCRH
jgi:hypothetical protein